MNVGNMVSNFLAPIKAKAQGVVNIIIGIGLSGFLLALFSFAIGILQNQSVVTSLTAVSNLLTQVQNAFLTVAAFLIVFAVLGIIGLFLGMFGGYGGSGGRRGR